MIKKNPQVWVARQIRRDLKMYLEYMETDFDMNSGAARSHLHHALYDYLTYFEEQGHIHWFDYVLDDCTGDGMTLRLSIHYKDTGWCKMKLSLKDLVDGAYEVRNHKGTGSGSKLKYLDRREEAYQEAMKVV